MKNVYKDSYELLPGDFVAYEKKGDIMHISTVTGLDSKGYALVTCHNTDRDKVPWDLGWNDKNYKVLDYKSSLLININTDKNFRLKIQVWIFML